MWLKLAEKTIKEARVSNFQLISDQVTRLIVQDPYLDLQMLKPLLMPGGQFNEATKAGDFPPNSTQSKYGLDDFNTESGISIDEPEYEDLRNMHPSMSKIDFVSIKIETFFSNKKMAPYATGRYWPTMKAIEIDIRVPVVPEEHRSQDSWRTLIQSIRMVVRHEFEHLFQRHRDPNRPIAKYNYIDRTEDPMAYYKAWAEDPYEQEADVTAIRNISKSPNRFVHLLKQRMEHRPLDAQLATAQKATERYPRLKPFVDPLIIQLQTQIREEQNWRNLLSRLQSEEKPAGGRRKRRNVPPANSTEAV